MNMDKTRSLIEKECLEKDVCFIQDFTQFIRTEPYLKMESNYAKCFDDDAIFYVQVFCQQNESELIGKTFVGLILGILIIVQACLFTYSIQ